ncbi:acetyl-CoA carboxylase [Clostridium novyi A str. 4552]|uniref:Biotin carboxyl carrier protein of acetyl-CoA carboxylase n=1 Tax=Clostridium novyi A str. 4552 TaxID=1444289 RepID=A0A0A0IBH6_CLONO|nr:acetyl-CoA carboxylase biotin carboxyl carrier protein [Clostridium novyi]EDS76939.1 acetyl-CoA carboxylase, biotin carboxyl carrier protein [Clostridium botulinum C str. Eklund]KGM96965.1 acetyl-CoA carboxylase [Clostridium novyi A str. 4552]NEZ48928.1 acetyl-CoA carboxylase biotin carboxyl carrier protein [Clostridium botulinum]
MDYKGIQEIIKTMSNSELTSLEIETKDIKIAMKKGEIVEGISREDTVPVTTINNYKEEIKHSESISEKEATIERVQETKVEDDNLTIIESPIVGTFYAAPSPDEDDFAQVGSKVKKGDTLCIIEAMKLMNEIEAEEDCEIVEILVKNEEMVEYGQPLFKVRV